MSPDNQDRRAQQGALLAGVLDLDETDLALIRSHRKALSADMEGLRERLSRFFAAEEAFAAFLESAEQRTRLVELICTYFLEMLDAKVGPERVKRVLAIGENHLRRGIPQVWVGAGYAVICEHLESRIAHLDLPEAERGRLRSALMRLLWWDRDVQLVPYDSRQRLYDFLEAKSEIAGLIASDLEERDLFEAICGIAVKHGGLALAWIGSARTAPGEPIPVLARTGQASAYADTIRVEVKKRSRRSAGPFGRCVEGNAPVIVGDIEQDRGMTPWHEQARQFGLGSVAAFPLREGAEIHAVLMVYSSERNYFTPDVAKLLEEIAREVSHALTERRHRKDIEELRDFYDALSHVNQLIAKQPERDELLQ